MSDELNNAEVKNFEEGDKVTGMVTNVENKQAYVQISGSKLDGIVPISELSNMHVETASNIVSVGDTLELMVTKVEEDLLILSKRKIDAEKAIDDIKARFESEEIFDVEIKDVVKGGLVADIGVRAFMPKSLVEKQFVEDFSGYKGKKLAVKIVEFEPENNRVILSHRAVAEQEEEKEKKAFLESLQEGDVLTGTIQRLAPFGVFVRLGNSLVDGLVHVSELSYDHVDQPSDVVQEGEEVNVKVIGIDPEKERISLSIKETLPGPWEGLQEKVATGSVLKGEVVRLTTFGAFVKLFPGIEGLVHVSQISSERIDKPSDKLQEGDIVEVKILEIDKDKKRLSLSIKALQHESQEHTTYELPEESSGFQMSDLIGDKLKNIKENKK